MKPTRKDPTNNLTLTAIAYLAAAQDARDRYIRELQCAISTYGERHTPQPSSPDRRCQICVDHGLIHTDHERLNHQTGSLISGIYADHFPEPIKVKLQTYTRVTEEQITQALDLWSTAGRRPDTLRSLRRSLYGE